MWGWLLAAVLSEVVATTSLRASEGFTRLGWSALVVVGYCSAFYALSQALVRGMPLGQAYAVWCALGSPRSPSSASCSSGSRSPPSRSAACSSSWSGS